MENKIIIDDVDVSKCEYYNAEDGTCRIVNGKYDTDMCDFDKCGDPNCDYKQLQREKEINLNNQQMVESAEKLIYDNAYLKGELECKTAECENYEQALDEIEKHFEHRCKICREEYEFYASCDVCWKKQILDIISKAKDSE